MAQLVFYDEGHRYEVDGEEVPSVSEVAKPFSAYKYDQVDETKLEVAADRGTEVHALTQAVDDGEDLTGEYDLALEGYLEAYRLYLLEHSVRHIARETPIHHPTLRYAGTPDAVSLVDGTLAIVDYKAVASLNKPGVKAQLNAYRLAWEATTNTTVDRLYALQLMPDGRYRLYPVAMDDASFLHCLALWRECTKKHPRGAIA